jgi:3',5'-cyclic AMP phosphodiesterase CpdA
MKVFKSKKYLILTFMMIALIMIAIQVGGKGARVSLISKDIITTFIEVITNKKVIPTSKEYEEENFEEEIFEAETFEEEVNLGEENLIPENFINHVNERVKKIKAITSENTTNLAFTTDNHIREGFYNFGLKGYNILNTIDKEIKLEAVINGGDTVAYGSEDKKEAIKSLKRIIKGFHDKKRHLYTVGNHDSNGMEAIYDKKYFLSDSEKYKILGRHLSKEVVWGSKSGMYYYKDIEASKIRIIVLNTSDLPWSSKKFFEGKLKYDILNTYAVQDEQLAWLGQKALNFEDKSDKNQWHTIIFCHTPLLDEREGIIDNNYVENKSLALGILEAFTKGTSYKGASKGNLKTTVEVDFSSQGPMAIIGVFSGHVHNDNHVVKGGINHVTTMADYAEKFKETMPERNIGEVSEICFDVITIDKGKRKVTLTRFGAGKDRVFNY